MPSHLKASGIFNPDLEFVGTVGFAQAKTARNSAIFPLDITQADLLMLRTMPVRARYGGRGKGSDGSSLMLVTEGERAAHNCRRLDS